MKKVKMCLYGEPGVGKSVFACKFPKPFFICTDGNYEWLEDFGAKADDHVNVRSWSEMKKAFDDDFTNYETVVVDLLEDGFKWCEQEFCQRNKIDHIGDLGYGKGYDITRNDFYVTISKLLAKDKNVILIMHGLSKVEKDRRGVEHTKYVPSQRIPDKVLDMIEGRVRYFLRCYLKAEEISTEDSNNPTLVKRRYLSIVPKENEYGIIRGVNENSIPHDIPLDYNEFAAIIGIDSVDKEEKPAVVKEVEEKPKKVKKVEIKQMVKEEIKEEVIEDNPPFDVEDVKPAVTPIERFIAEQLKVEQPKAEQPKVEIKPIKQPLSNEDKVAAIKARIAAARAKQ